VAAERAGGHGVRVLLLGYAAANEREIRDGVRRLAEALSSLSSDNIIPF